MAAAPVHYVFNLAGGRDLYSGHYLDNLELALIRFLASGGVVGGKLRVAFYLLVYCTTSLAKAATAAVKTTAILRFTRYSRTFYNFLFGEWGWCGKKSRYR